MMVNERRVYDVIATSTSSNHRSWAAVVKSDLLKSQSQYVIFFRPSVNQNLTSHYLDPSFMFLFVTYPCEAGLGKLGLRTYEQKQGPLSPWRAKIGLTGLKEVCKRWILTKGRKVRRRNRSNCVHWSPGRRVAHFENNVKRILIIEYH